MQNTPSFSNHNSSIWGIGNQSNIQSGRGTSNKLNQQFNGSYGDNFQHIMEKDHHPTNFKRGIYGSISNPLVK